MKRYFEYIDEKSSKFWQIEKINGKIYKTYGKIGTKGITKEHILSSFNSYGYGYDTEFMSQIRSKLKKGYIEKDINKINETKSLDDLINNFRKLL